MRTNPFSVIVFCILLFINFSCSPKKFHLDRTESLQYRIIADAKIDSAVHYMIQPYKQGLDSEMNLVLAVSEIELKKGKPESLLGNFVADLILKKCEDYSGKKIDFSIINNGGLRIPSLPKGKITKGKIFELMPFDNELVVMDVDGKTVLQLLNIIAKDGGCPVAGVRFSIRDTVAENIFIGGKELDTGKNYKLAISDYLANGGDDLTMLKGKPRINLNKLFRDAIIEYLQEVTAKGEKIKAELDRRIKNAQ